MPPPPGCTINHPRRRGRHPCRPRMGYGLGASRMPRPTVGVQKRPLSATRYGVGTVALRHCRGIALSADGALGRWGISRRARRDWERCPLDPAILGCPPFVGKRGRRGILRQAKVWRKRPGEHRRHTDGGWPSQKNRVKLLSFSFYWGRKSSKMMVAPSSSACFCCCASVMVQLNSWTRYSFRHSRRLRFRRSP